MSVRKTAYADSRVRWVISSSQIFTERNGRNSSCWCALYIKEGDSLLSYCVLTQHDTGFTIKRSIYLVLKLRVSRLATLNVAITSPTITISVVRDKLKERISQLLRRR